MSKDPESDENQNPHGENDSAQDGEQNAAPGSSLVSAGADSDDTQESVESSGATIRDDRTATAGPGRAVAVLALLVALLSAAAAGFLWWQYRQFYVELDKADASSEAALERARAEMVTLEDRLKALGETDSGLDRSLKRLGGDLSRIPPRLLEFEERLQAIQGVSYDARRIWMTAEINYLLALANSELALGGRWESAKVALQQADEKLRDLANPALTPVRDEIAAAVLAMDAVALPDIEGLSLSLGTVTESLESLPLRSDDMANFAPNRKPDEVPPGFERAWASFKAAIAGMVRIDRRDEPVQRALTAREGSLVRWGTQLELTAARLALLRGDQEVFEQSLRAAIENLGSYFDTREQSVNSSIELLREIEKVSVDPNRPDISAPLNTLRRLTAGPLGNEQ